MPERQSLACPMILNTEIKSKIADCRLQFTLTWPNWGQAIKLKTRLTKLFCKSWIKCTEIPTGYLHNVCGILNPGRHLPVLSLRLVDVKLLNVSVLVRTWLGHVTLKCSTLLLGHNWCYAQKFWFEASQQNN